MKYWINIIKKQCYFKFLAEELTLLRPQNTSNNPSKYLSLNAAYHKGTKGPLFENLTKFSINATLGKL